MLKCHSLEKTGIGILNGDCNVIIPFNHHYFKLYIFSALNSSK